MSIVLLLAIKYTCQYLCLNLLNNISEFWIFSYLVVEMSGETKRNLALIWTHEIRHRYSNDFVKLLVDYILEKEVEDSFEVSTS